MPQHAQLSVSRLLKNPSSLSFRGAAGDEESRKSYIFRARFLPIASLWVGMTRFRNVFQQLVKGRPRKLWNIGSLIVLALLVPLGVSFTALRLHAAEAGAVRNSPARSNTLPSPSLRFKTGESRLTRLEAALPLSFETNEGQTDSNVRYLAHGPRYTLFLTPTAAVLALPSNSSAKIPAAWIRMKIVGAAQHPQIAGLDELLGKTNYFIGNNPQKWRTGIPNYGKVEYRKIYPGTDLIYYGNHQQIECDFRVSPGADPAKIRLSFGSPQGALPVRLDARGNLRVATARGDFHLLKPFAYQEFDSKQGLVRRAVSIRYVLKRGGVAAFKIGSYDRVRPLLIDPVLVFSSYVGGGGGDSATGIALDGSGNVFITGSTGSTNFPTSNPLQKSIGGSTDAFVTEMNPTGSSLVYSTYLGGTGSDKGTSIALDSSGNAYVTGYTSSSNFPVTSSAFSKTYQGFGKSEAFVAKLNPSGSSLVYATYLGGSGGDFGQGIAVDASGNAYITGSTLSANFPTASALQGTLGGGSDAFVTELNQEGSALVYSTYLGGAHADSGQAIAVDGGGEAYVTGFTFSSDFPTKNPLYPYGGAGDAFVAKLSAGGSSLVYSTYLGGSGEDRGLALALDASGEVYLTGSTQSGNFPVSAGAWQTTLAGATDAFVAKLNPQGSQVVYATFLGGSQNDQGNGIALDNSGNAYITGSTASGNFPTLNPSQGTLGGGACATTCSNAFVSVLNPQATGLVYSTFLGGSGPDYGQAITVSASGNAYVAGSTASANFPAVSGAFQASYGGAGTSGNAFVTEISASNAPGVALNPQKINFGNQGQGVATAPQTVTLTNVGSAALNISGISTTADFAQTNTCGNSVSAGGASCTIKVTFTPSQIAAETGTLSITDNAAGSPQTVTLSGTGVTPAPIATFSASALTFNNQIVGTSSAPQSVTLTNTGTATLNITKITISGAYTETDNCPSSLEPSKNCTINVTFSPTATSSSSSSSSSSSTASNTGALSLTDNATGTAPTVTLNGTAIADFTLSVSAQTTPIVVGTGSTTFTVSAASLLSSFTSQISLSCSSEVTCSFSPSTITPGQTSTMTVSGLANPTSNPLTFTLTGSASSGNQTATSSVAVNFADYSLSGSPPLNTITAGQSASYTIRVASANGFSNSVSLSCSSGLPGASSCSFAPASVTPAAGGAATTTLTITTTAHSKARVIPMNGRRSPPPGPFWIFGIGLLLLGLGVAARITGRRQIWLLLGMALLVAVLLAGCNLGYYGFIGSNPAPTGSPAGVYTVAVTGTYTPSSSGSSPITRSTTVNLAVQ